MSLLFSVRPAAAKCARRTAWRLVRLLATVALHGMAWSAGKAQVSPTAMLDRAAQRQVIERLADVLENRYVISEVAFHTAASLRQAEERGEFVAARDPAAFAEALSEHLRRVSGDGHLWVALSAGEFPEPAEPRAPRSDQAQSSALARSNFGVSRAEVLPGNVGYLDIRQFVTPALGGRTIAAAFEFLASADALIVDVRSSMGGSPDMVLVIASYLFEPTPVHLFSLYHRPSERTDQYRTLAYLPGARFVHRPVYVLTATSTFSAGEGLAYTLSQQGRATIVGDTTAGGAHPGRLHRLSEQFVAFVAEARVTSPLTNGNWEAVGVVPHVAVPAEHALEHAHLLALEQLRLNESDPARARELDELIQDRRARS
jgi:hypothetical protein